MLQDFRARFKKKSSLRKDFVNFVEFCLGYAVLLGINLFLMRKINHALSQEEMGRYSFITSLVLIVGPILYFAAPQAYIRFHEQHNIARSLRKFLLPFCWLSVFGLAVIIYWCGCSWFALLYAFLPLFTEKTYLLRCQMNITKMNILQIGVQALTLLLVVLWCREHMLKVSTLLGFFGIGYLLSSVFPVRGLTDGQTDRRKVMRFLGPIVFTTLLSTFLANSAVMFAKYFFGYEGAGVMGVAVKAALTMNSFFTIFLMFFPLIYIREAAKGNFHLIHLYRNSIMIIVSIFCVLAAIFHREIYYLLGAEQYGGHSILFVILIGVAFFNFIADIYWLYFAYEIKTWKNSLLKLASCAIIFAGIGFTPKFGITYIAFLLLLAAAVPAVTGAMLALYSERKRIVKGSI